MRRAIGIFVLFTAAPPLAGACASGGSDVDSESHFQCGEDGDCRNAYGRSICVSGWCEFPGGTQTVLNELSGPPVDCTTEWPATTLRFETAESSAHRKISDDAFSSGPWLNRNGTVVIGLAEYDERSHWDAHLIRWAGDIVSRFKMPLAGPMIPSSVSCDGMTIAGWTVSNDPYRWTARNGFSQLPGDFGGPLDGSYRVTAMSSDGTTTWGTFEPFTRAGVTGFSVAIRWNNDLAETLFALPQGGHASPGWSGDARVFTGYTNDDLFVQTAGALPTYLETPLELRTGSPTAISFDSSVIAGTFTDTSGAGATTIRSYLWSSRNQLEYLPENAFVSAVTPGGVAVGSMDYWPELSVDTDLVWDRSHGARHLREVLATHGLQLPADTTIDICTSITADGRVIAGLGREGNGSYIFRAILPAGAFD